MKQSKHILFFILSPILTLIGEILFVFLMLSFLDSMLFNSVNMASPKSVIIVSLVMCALFGLIEYAVRNVTHMEWYTFLIGAMLVPLVIELVGFIVVYAKWYSNRTSEDWEFFRYFLQTLLIYLMGTVIFRVIFHFLPVLFVEIGERRKEKRRQKRALEREKAKNKK